ncbi:TraB/GumN family protein [Haloferax mediterranei ATCC 33500]|uniref:Conjugal transfer protein TraB n=1 Tax=Haloferax mediterranei (strain ATCC 33500 / DSM 1411 / JCM 8866 / NBRC 14739 / NCIMB 2177 / R-4) TaxID=523841 RepID=I3R512_HALMT|nr:TraB/GumN family protein [Haloferax mediterranei]AFK19322.1 plasmid transfer protein [Haloferax mediterranei ATCC 33500]AHZ21323.1 conjugal transfer protein TraB [Haloferax mediterranei ATCC 33500]EMA04489.1 plasmid transfer protein [Haloferax mediterranei ATCC 33500]MDX5989425.1 TraB/GumN family protein [Haloferax mediterranei ATCC 33500]QCQ75790.1 TraB/GumN family protein [Haloferax mediterranei ATCC 33500]
MNDSSPGEGHVRVVGTAHVSADSVREVEETVKAEQPDVVAVELDEGRYRQLKGGSPDDIEASDLLRGNTVFQFIAYWMLSYVQAQMGEKFDVKPGADMLAAVETAESEGLDVALVDRNIQTTIQRFWRRMGIVEKMRMAGELLFGFADARGVGAVFGIAVGVFLGPLVGLYGDAVGITDLILTRTATAAVVGGAASYMLYTIASFYLDGDDALLAGLGGGTAIGIILSFGLGIGTGLATAVLKDLGIAIVGSLVIGIVAGVAVGVVAGVVLNAIGLFAPAEGVEDYEEYDMADLTDGDVVSAMMEEFRRFSPGGAEALIDERDAFIAHKLVALRQSGHDVVAVVGAGHKAGIESYLERPETLPPMESLVGVSEKKGFPWGKLIGFGVTAVFIGFFVLLAMAGISNERLLTIFGAWFLINGIFAGTLAKLAGARWSGALVGGLVAWMTSINPLLAPGWFTGYVELRHTPVNVGDIGKLNELLSDEETPIPELVGQMFDVPLFKLIMVVAMTNIGSIIASFLFVTYVIPVIASDLGGASGVANLMFEGARNSADLIWRTLT